MDEVNSELWQRLQAKLLAKPFAPFSIETRDGRRFEFVRQFQAAMNDQILIYMPPDERGQKLIRPKDLAAIIPG